MTLTPRPLLAALALLTSVSLFAQEAEIRKNLAERLPKLPKIDEVTRTAIPGLWEVRYGGTEILYSDDKGEYVINGNLLETKTRTDLTEQRVDKLTAVDFDKLPVKDAMVMKQGNGSRKMAVFVDPNCGYCKRFEKDLVQLKDVTIYNFLIPILGPDSVTKSRDIWCGKEPTAIWRSWMLDGKVPAKTMGNCDTAALDRNLDFSRAHRINGTPSVYFVDGTHKPGALPLDAVEKLLVASAAPKKDGAAKP